jgi:hypothetical protein
LLTTANLAVVVSGLPTKGTEREDERRRLIQRIRGRTPFLEEKPGAKTAAAEIARRTSSPMGTRSASPW